MDYKRLISLKKKHWLRDKWWKNVFQANESHKQAGVAILITDKVRRDSEYHFILIKGTIHQEEI
jgi:hypothetical protein